MSNKSTKSFLVATLEFLWHVYKDHLLGKPSSSQYDGYIYFIQSVNGGNIKIGYSNNPQKRLATFQTAQADRLVILGLMPGDIRYEKQLHRQFAKYRIRGDGEWFQPSSDIINFIHSNTSGGVGVKPATSFWGELLSGLINPQKEEVKIEATPEAVVPEIITEAKKQECLTCLFGHPVKFLDKNIKRWCMKDGMEVSTTHSCSKYVEL